MIRPARHLDIPVMLEMSKRFYEASGYSDVTDFDQASMNATLEGLLSSEDAVLLVAGEQPIGMASALLYPFYFNAHHRTAQELFWWVDEEHRGVGASLLDALTAAVKAKGAQSLSMICLDRLNPEKVGHIYERRGFRPSERSYIKKL